VNFRNRISLTLAIVLLIGLQGAANAKSKKPVIAPPGSPTLVSVETIKSYWVVKKVKVVSRTKDGRTQVSYKNTKKRYTDVQVKVKKSRLNGGAPITSTVVAGGGKTCTVQVGKSICTLVKIRKGTKIFVRAKSKNKKGYSALSSIAKYVTGTAPWPMPKPVFSVSKTLIQASTTSPISSFIPISTGGPIAKFSILEKLPLGISLNVKTGRLSGTAKTAQVAKTYTLAGTNESASYSRKFKIEVIAAPSFTLAVASEQIAINSSIALFGLTPTGGTTVTYSVSPQLPAGVSLDSQTGLVSGTPVAPQPLTAYTITATNITGQESHTYSLQVIAAPDFSLSATSERLPKNNQISGYTINSSGGQTSIFSITPSIPNGTVFNTTTGLLSGTPTLPQGPTEYTIIGTNIAGSMAKTFSLEVTNPPVFTLSTSAVSVFLGDSVVSYSINSAGSLITSFALDQPLPAGLVLDPATGLLSGTPTASQPLTTYTLTGTNSIGSVSESFTLTVDLTCATGGACVVGNTGPGGGYVFYVNSDGFTCGELMDTTCKYLELAPNTWAGGSADPKMAITPSAQRAAGSIAGLAEFSADIMGRGAWNTRHMVSAWGSSENYPALAADNYTSNYLGVSKSDWFIGSRDELGAMAVAKASLPPRFAYAADKYWPSSFNPGYVSNVDGGECGTSWPQGVGPGATTSTNKPTGTAYSVRAIRAW
jgi:hypothetical protein